METIRVQVPATSANCGPGFDCLGLALSLYNVFSFSPNKDALNYTYTFKGLGADLLVKESPANNLIGQAMLTLFTKAQQAPVYGHILVDTHIPPARGLGSSSTAIVAGLLLANALLVKPFSMDVLLEVATEIEGHPDNVAPALLGDLVCALVDKGRLLHRSIAVPKDLYFALVVPDVLVSTEYARSVLPSMIKRTEAVANVSRTALFVTAMMQNKTDYLQTAMQDYLHVPYRKTLIPHCEAAFTAALQEGSYGVTISGSGSTLIAYTNKEKAETVAEAMKAIFLSHDIKAETLVLQAAHGGASYL